MADLSDKRILVVDDVGANIDILVDTLGDDYLVSGVLDGFSAMEEILEAPPDLVLLDILMPDMDGYEVCRQIKAEPATRDVVVIFVTSLTEPVDETHGLDLGAVDYITKPFTPSVIRARVRTHLELAEARKELERQNELLKENIRLREQVEQITRHDLKNPLQVMLGSAQLLCHRREHEGLDVPGIAKDQVRACYTMLDMINRSLDLYRMENGSYVLKAVLTDILPLADRILFGGQRLVKAKELRVAIMINQRPRTREDCFEVHCDELLFHAMLGNLVTNALEASPRGGEIRIVMDRDKEITIAVENRGAVPLEIRDHFFEKFVTAGKSHGTGLGTYSARLTAELHGGRLDLYTCDKADITRVTIHLAGSLAEMADRPGGPASRDAG